MNLIKEVTELKQDTISNVERIIVLENKVNELEEELTPINDWLTGFTAALFIFLKNFPRN